MAVAIAGAKPSGRPIRWSGKNSATEGLFSKNKADEIARSAKAPPTFWIGNSRFVDEGIFRAWAAALASGQIEITIEDLRAVRENATPRAKRTEAQAAA